MATTRLAAVDELTARIDPKGNVTFDAATLAGLGSILDRVSQMLNRQARRFFGKTDSQTRYYTAEWPDRLVVPVDEPEIVSITTLKTDVAGALDYSRTWATADYQLCPANAAIEWPAQPYREIVASIATGSAGYAFPLWDRGVQIVGVFGFPSVPAIVREMCIQEALVAWNQVKNPTGVIASAELGRMLVELQLHPSTVRELNTLRRTRFNVARAAWA